MRKCVVKIIYGKCSEKKFHSSQFFYWSVVKGSDQIGDKPQPHSRSWWWYSTKMQCSNEILSTIFMDSANAEHIYGQFSTIWWMKLAKNMQCSSAIHSIPVYSVYSASHCRIHYTNTQSIASTHILIVSVLWWNGGRPLLICQLDYIFSFALEIALLFVIRCPWLQPGIPLVSAPLMAVAVWTTNRVLLIRKNANVRFPQLICSLKDAAYTSFGYLWIDHLLMFELLQCLPNSPRKFDSISKLVHSNKLFTTNDIKGFIIRSMNIFRVKIFYLISCELRNVNQDFLRTT